MSFHQAFERSAAPSSLPPLTRKQRKNFVSGFSLLINDRINLWNAPHKFSDRDRSVLGGIPNNISSMFLAEKILDFLEEKRLSGAANLGNIASELVGYIQADPEIFESEHGLTGKDRRLTQAARLLIVCSMNRIFVKECNHYRSLKTPEAYASMGNYIYDEGRDFLQRVGRIYEATPTFNDEMQSLCKDLVGHHVLSLSHIPENIGYHLNNRISRIHKGSVAFLPANDWI